MSIYSKGLCSDPEPPLQPQDPNPSTLSPSQTALVESVLGLYRQGWFPMSDPDTGQTEWVQPTRRALLPLDRMHVPRRLEDRVRSRRFVIRTDTDFVGVMRGCAEPRPGREETWINSEIVGIFTLLHRAGHAHSVEAWLPTPAGEVLVGGVYGLSMGAVFAGESMFSRPEMGGTDASKVCLVHLARHLAARGYKMLDAQMANHHTAQFGLEEMPAEEYLRALEGLVDQRVAWQPFGDYAGGRVGGADQA